MRIRVAAPDDAATLIDFNAAMARETEGKELLPEVIGAGGTEFGVRVAICFHVRANELRP